MYVNKTHKQVILSIDEFNKLIDCLESASNAIEIITANSKEEYEWLKGISMIKFAVKGFRRVINE